MIKEIKGDIWEFWKNGKWIIITTNGYVKKNGEAVMGRGIALQAKLRHPSLPKELGNLILQLGNVPMFFMKLHLITFPVKYNWWEKADLKLIEDSAKLTCEWSKKVIPNEIIYITRVGCGNGKLLWKEVKPILERQLDSRFIVCDSNST